MKLPCAVIFEEVRMMQHKRLSMRAPWFAMLCTMLLAGCEIQSDVQGRYRDSQEHCRTGAERTVSRLPNVVSFTPEQQNAELINQFSACMNQSGWHVANPIKPAPAAVTAAPASPVAPTSPPAPVVAAPPIATALPPKPLPQQAATPATAQPNVPTPSAPVASAPQPSPAPTRPPQPYQRATDSLPPAEAAAGRSF